MSTQKCLKVVVSLFLLWSVGCASAPQKEGQKGSERTENSQMPSKLIAISSGHTGCLPSDITNPQILMSETGWGNQWFYVWQFQCHHKKFVCSLLWIGGQGTGVDAHCSKLLPNQRLSSLTTPCVSSHLDRLRG